MARLVELPREEGYRWPPDHLKETINIPPTKDYRRGIFLTLGDRIGNERNFCITCASPLLTFSETGESFCPECDSEKLPKKIHVSTHEIAQHCPTCATPLLYTIGSAKHGTRTYFCPHCIRGRDAWIFEKHGLESNTNMNEAVVHLDAESFSEWSQPCDVCGEGTLTQYGDDSDLWVIIECDNCDFSQDIKMKEAETFEAEQVVPFGVVGSGNDFGQNLAEEYAAESEGRSMWFCAAVAAIGFVIGMSYKDLREDTSSE